MRFIHRRWGEIVNQFIISKRGKIMRKFAIAFSIPVILVAAAAILLLSSKPAETSCGGSTGQALKLTLTAPVAITSVTENYFALPFDHEAFAEDLLDAVPDAEYERCSQIVGPDGCLADCGGPAFNCECVTVPADKASAALDVLGAYALNGV